LKKTNEQSTRKLPLPHVASWENSRLLDLRCFLDPDPTELQFVMLY
jgi:hypothetical protein